ncbi:hypothetical protein PUN28_000951 [Cardiocondyla obscurior]|uniref:Uncharacterized protein n=1 Tax=Cardiocondyla obscurior TaxID=286306 RepID=A0AAW2H1X1_9HYME
MLLVISRPIREFGNARIKPAILRDQCEDGVETACEEVGHSDGRSGILRGGGGLGKASCSTGATPESPAEIYNSAETHADR